MTNNFSNFNQQGIETQQNNIPVIPGEEDFGVDLPPIPYPDSN